MTKDLSNLTILITGSGNGMGQSHAILMAERGANIIVHDISSEGVNKTINLIKQIGFNARPFVMDIRDTDSFQKEIAKFGPIDILVNNAGVGGKAHKIEAIDTEIFDNMFNVHVRGTFFATQAVIPQMKDRKSGKIINTSSIFAMGGNDSACHYSAAKSAISGLTKSWAREFAEWNIKVNAVAPGFVETDMTRASLSREQITDREKLIPLGRFCEPIDISYAVAWLASPEADLVSGQIISPNGGEVITGY